MLKVLDFASWYFGKAADLYWAMDVETFKEVKSEYNTALAILATIVFIILQLVCLCLMLVIIFTEPIWGLILDILELAGFSNLVTSLYDIVDKCKDITFDNFEKYNLM